MNDIRDLYQEVILDHGTRPRNFHPMKDASHQAEGFNPLCGDRITLYLRLEGDRVLEASFEGVGCAISKASASLMTSALKGMTREEAETLFTKFHEMLTGERGGPIAEEVLGKLAVFSGVCEFPARVKCATLAWHTFHAALERKEGTVSIA